MSRNKKFFELDVSYKGNNNLYPCSYHFFEEIEYDNYLWNLLCTLLQFYPLPFPCRGNHDPDFCFYHFFDFLKFYHNCLVLQAFEKHIKRIILDVLFCNFLFLLNIMSLRLIHVVSEAVSLFFLAASFYCMNLTIDLAFLLLMKIWVVSHFCWYNDAAMNFFYVTSLKLSKIYNQSQYCWVKLSFLDNYCLSEWFVSICIFIIIA